MSTLAANAQTKHFAYIDSLRGIAICAVILVHTALYFPLTGIPSRLAVQGGTGVQLFFIVSALTLMFSMTSRNARERRPIGNFFIRRFFRIAPAYYLFTAIFLVLFGLAPRAFAPRGVTQLAIVSTIAFVNGWRPDTINVPVFGEWSVAVEMTFYLILPLLFRYVRNFRAAAFGWLLSVALFVFLTPVGTAIGALSGYPPHHYLVVWFESLWFPSQLPVFFSGLCVFFAIRQSFSIRRFALVSGVALVVLAPLCLLLRLEAKPIIAGIVFSNLVLYLSRFPMRILVNPVFEYMGKISFSAYLVHDIIIESARPLFVPLAFPNASLRFVAAYLAVASATAVAATLIWRLVEVPFQNLGKRIVAANEMRGERKMIDVTAVPSSRHD